MENRIQINGVWYVREINQPEIEFNEDDITTSIEKAWESENWVFDANILLRSNAETLDEHYGDPWIEITDKRSKEETSWVTHSVDNPAWMLDMYEGNTESLEYAQKILDKEGIEEFKKFIGYLVKIGWIIKK